MLPTPSTSHVDYSRIYEPSEDSYLFLDTVSSAQESAFLQHRFQRETSPPLALEVGTGSGIVIAFLLANAERILGRSDVAGLGVDLNRFACGATGQTARLASREAKDAGAIPGVFLDGITSDLTAAFRPQSVDVLLFNPPYVPSEELPSNPADREETPDAFKRDSHLLALSTDGGAEGMETTDRLLAELPFVLSLRGVAYVLLCAQNKPQQIVTRIRGWPGGWSVEVVGSSGKQAGWERLCIIRIWRNSIAPSPS